MVAPATRNIPILDTDDHMILFSVTGWGLNPNAHAIALRRFAVNGGRGATSGGSVRRMVSGVRGQCSQQCVLVAATDLQAQSVIQYCVVIAIGIRRQLTYASHADQR